MRLYDREAAKRRKASGTFANQLRSQLAEAEMWIP